MLLATLVAAGALSPGDLATASDALRAAGGAPGAAAWLDAGDAADVAFAGLGPTAARAALEAALPGIDAVVQAAGGRAKRLLIADMDSTMIQCECIDELADYAGRRAEVAAVTERAMAGELDFAAALRERVALLQGLDERAIARCLAERVRATPGARALVVTMRGRGAATVLVSGGFTAFAGPVGTELGFGQVIANTLDLAGGRLAGTVREPIVDAAAKRTALVQAAGGAGVLLADCLAVGDGANDIPMLEAAGLGVAYRAKPRAAAAADAAVRHGDLTVLLWAQGLRRADWAG